MIKLKETVDARVLEQYGFKAREVREWDYKTHSAYYRLVYTHSFSYLSGEYLNLQSVNVYIQPWYGAYGQLIRSAREVEANQHCGKVDNAVELIVKLVALGIFEIVESER